MALLMGLRASEVLSRVVRDIDCGGEYLRVDDNEDVAFRLKTESSRRPVLIPTLLRPLLAQLAARKRATDPLFPGRLGGRRRRQWLHVQVGSLCKKAGVPVVCSHSLRGWMTTSAVAAGELPEVVAREIGHASAQMTLEPYISPGVAEAARLKRGQAAFAAALPATLPA
jgi:integrase